jgi:hypothetical protein
MTIYRGYIIKFEMSEYRVYLEGKLMTAQPSEERAMLWIDQQKRKRQEALK